jgi:hypothetical protein
MTKSNYSLHNIANGDRGIKQTLDLMSSLVKQFKITPQVRELSMRIVQHVPNQNFTQEARTLHKWVQRNIRYVRDVRDVETIQTPIKTLQLKAGDCDDQSLILAALLEAIGHRTRFLAVGFHNKPFSHVFPETRVGSKWATMECTKPLRFGEKLKNVTKVMRVHN